MTALKSVAVAASFQGTHCHTETAHTHPVTQTHKQNPYNEDISEKENISRNTQSGVNGLILKFWRQKCACLLIRPLFTHSTRKPLIRCDQIKQILLVFINQ